MTAEVGHFSLIMAMMIAGAQMVIPQIGAWRRDARMLAFGDWAAVAQLLFLTIAFVALARAFVTSDFSVRIVAEHSNAAMPLFFRLAATWGNHEGSLLLWVLVLALFGAGLALLGRDLPATLRARTLAVQATIATGFIALSVATSNPFERLHPAPPDGAGLNPLLQDVGLVLHPPFLYVGYVGFSIVFSFAVAGLLEGRVDATWARFVRPWVLAAWISLTIGIALGSFWAYYELGWGGWWFWDPVENASFMPWLVGTALLHSAIVVEKRHSLVVWTILLSILTFSLSLIGTFLVRSGILTSVHAFASDPSRGIGVLMLLTGLTGGALTLFAARAHKLDQPQPFQVISREGGLVLNNILLVVAAATVFLGTFYPLLAEMLGPDKISVGAPYFNRTFVPLVIPLLLAVAVGPMLRWKRDRLGEALGRMKGTIALAGAGLLAAIVWFGVSGTLGVFGLALAGWLVFGSLAIIGQRLRIADRDIVRSLRLAVTTPRATWGSVAAHAGLGLMVAGIAAVTAWEDEKIVSVLPGTAVEVGGYSVVLGDVTVASTANHEAERASFAVFRNGRPLLTMTSERRFYPAGQRVTTEAGIRPRFLGNLYIALGERNNDGSRVVRLYYHPGVLLIWIGPVLMAFGGLLSLSDRRFRVGAPGRKRLPAAAAAAQA